MPPLVAHCHLGLAKLYRRTGKREQAQEHSPPRRRCTARWTCGSAGNVDPAEVASIMLSSAKYRTLPGPKHPADLIGVAHSPAYFIAAAVADKGYGSVPRPQRSPTR
jgi:hypothetical protein